MSYIGNIPTTVAFLVDTFSGNGSTTAFTLSQAPANTSSILVAVSGVVQDPSTYSVSGTTLTFSGAPPSGSSNISVRFLGIPASGVTTTAYRTVTEFTATAGQTTFSVPSYTAGYIDVYRNGVMLGSADYTATNGTSVVLANPATAGDLVETISFYVSSVLNAIPAVANAVTDTYLNTGAVTQTKLAAGVAGNGPLMLATLSSNQTIATTTLTTVALDSVIYDTSSRFNPTGSTVGGIPAYSFMPTVAGYYQINTTVNVENSSTLSRWILNFSTASLTYRLADNYYNAGSGAGSTVSSGSSIIYLNGTTDYVQLSVYIAAGTPVINSGVSTTRFSVGLLRSA